MINSGYSEHGMRHCQVESYTLSVESSNSLTIFWTINHKVACLWALRKKLESSTPEVLSRNCHQLEGFLSLSKIPLLRLTELSLVSRIFQLILEFSFAINLSLRHHLEEFTPLYYFRKTLPEEESNIGKFRDLPPGPHFSSPFFERW